ncbi:aa3-type cytochrome oxidase subunit II [Trujillonella endophytica]|uniref:cytochrome-c oxidase n=1 Tax=Trujillonella endophytica TaxID=673521 RepID=A0A1H8VNQ6_9ACTN|nr:cytochrome c oxidase subunit II [Trujillella endophytica]SEP17041.1 cytochrome c oxidase subunit 2 [Trujillella endophytica]
MARGNRLARVAALGLLGVPALSGCTPDNEFWRWGWPEGITEQSQDIKELWIWSVIAALIVGILVWALIFWSMVKHRKKGDELPRQTAYNLPLEIVYSIIPFLIIAGLFFFTVVVQNKVQERSDEPDVNITVQAFKWNWEFLYADTAEDEEDQVSTVGTSEEIPILVLPTEQTVQFYVRSADVIHSFWVPEFLFKLDVIPGNANGRDNVFEVTIEEGREGAYVGRCAELCGTYHAYMNFELRVVSQEQYADYLELREGGATTAEALAEVDPELGGYSVATEPYDLERDAQQVDG